MTKLDGNFLTLGMGKFNGLGERLDLRILPESEILRGDATFWDDGGGFDDGEAGTAGNDAAKMG